MKNNLSLLLSWFFYILFLFYFIPAKGQEAENVNSFCTKLNELIEAGRNGFQSVKGEMTTKNVTGAQRNFYVATIDLNEENKGYINSSEIYPEYSIFFATAVGTLTPELKAMYENIKTQLTGCLSDEEWNIHEQNKDNSTYFANTEYKKLKIKELTDKKEKIKMELAMYSNRVVKKRVVELKIEGIGE